MTIPFQTPQIGPTGVVPAGPNFLDIVIGALQKRQELDQAREDLKRKREQFELNAKLAGAQIEGMELNNEKMKRDFKERELTLAAMDRALQRYTGNLPRLHDAAGIGQVIADIKDPLEAAEFYKLLQSGAQATSAATPNYQFQNVPGQTATGQEVIGFNPEDPTHPVRTGVAATPPQTEQRRVPVVTEREKASYAVGAIQGDAIVNRIEQAHPDVAARVARKVAARKGILTGILHRLTGTSREDADLLTEQAIEQSMGEDELEFYQAAKQYLANTIPAIAGKQMTAREYAIQAPTYFSMGGGSPTVMTNRRKARASRIRGFIAEAGDAMAERIAELQGVDLSPYGLGSVTLPDSTRHEISPGRAKYHPRYRTAP